MRGACSIVLGIVLMAFLVPGPAVAGSNSPRITVQNSVVQGQKLRITVRECVSGDGWNAVIRIALFSEAPTVSPISGEKDAEDDGTTVLRVKVPRRWPAARDNFAKIQCIHQFDGGGEDRFYEEQERFRVKDAA
ncbi:MAG TPA: hypothetical protein VFK59_03025 [Actinomycetota bacterium]|nr:hypothetical protein [Actinomycetota bacterium]